MDSNGNINNTHEEILKSNHIEFKRLREEKPLLYHNIIKSMQQARLNAFRECAGWLTVDYDRCVLNIPDFKDIEK